MDSMPSTENGKLHAFWCEAINQYEKESRKWVERSKKIVKRYKDERGNLAEGQTRYNILWSNIQTLKPALYAKDPAPEVERRFKDEDPIGRVSSEVLERCLSFSVCEHGFGDVMRETVLDRLLVGRGTCWVRYIPHFRDSQLAGNEEVKGEGAQISDDAEHEYEQPQEIEYEEIAYDYVYFEDFGCSKARTWEETRAVWRKAFLDKEELSERFGAELAALIPLDHKDENAPEDTLLKKATIYEIWDKQTCKAIWLHKNYPEVLDVRDDPLKLDKFFPCPKPLFGTLGNDSTIPVPDYALYQDQAKELDTLTQRIAMITKAIKVAGVYDASAAGIQRLMTEGVQNQLIPIDNWAAFAERGGIAGAVSMLPVMEIAQVLQSLYEIRDKVKEDLYEISGMSDIIRGASNPQETATAQQIKANYASVRLNDMQKEVQRFARDLLRIAGQIISNFFQVETLKQISGTQLLTAQEKMVIQQQMAIAQQTGQPPQIDQNQIKLLNEPSWDDVDRLLKDSTTRQFRIDIETDSTIQQDQQQEQQARVEFVQTIGTVLTGAAQIAQQAPTLMPALAESIKFLIRGFKVGRPTQAAFDEALTKMEELANNPPQQEQQQPDRSVEVEQVRQQGAMQTKQVEAQSTAQLEQMKQQHALELENIKAQSAAQVETIKGQAQAAIEQMRLEGTTNLEKYKADLEHEREMRRMINDAAQREADRSQQALQADADREANRETKAETSD